MRNSPELGGLGILALLGIRDASEEQEAAARVAWYAAHDLRMLKRLKLESPSEDD